jgi:hypothetical protein
MYEGMPFYFIMKNCDNKPEECIVAYTDHEGGEIQHQHRGWLNLGYMWNDGASVDEYPDWDRAVDPNTDANQLKEWMENGCQNCPPLWWGDYIHAKPGTNSSAIGAAPLEPEEQPIYLPIFDEVPHYDDIDGPKPPAASQGGDYYYHIVGYLAYEVTDSNQGAGMIDGKVVKVVTAKGQVGNGRLIGFGQGNACKTMAQAVNLWR